ncbi:phage late control D family protein [Streptomyces yerevanensis]|uniref:phage late control D family protein n=1 Tax=Streptomyces yerevanensis TaxID=66378 RepID=UPI0005247D83|nr:phage late control D family protein [Streptomyces yerevanensis]
MATPPKAAAAPYPADISAPRFTITLDGAETAAVNNSVVDIQVVRELDRTGTFSLTLSNWDETQQLLRFGDDKVFAAGRPVMVRLGYTGPDDPPVVAFGHVTGVQADFSTSGPALLRVTCQDSTTRMKDRKPESGDVKKFLNLADWQIADRVAQRYGLGLVAEKGGVVHPVVVQTVQDDAAFLLARAKGIDREFYVAPDPRSGVEKLYFVCPADGRAGSTERQPHTFDLWYKGPGRGDAAGTAPVPNLISFRPSVRLSGQVAMVTVRGWDPRTKKEIVATATDADVKAEPDAGRSGPAAAAQTMGGRGELIVNRPVFSEEEARALAASVLRDRAYHYVTCTGRLTGAPALVPSDSLRIGGVGSRFGGTYYTTKVSHSFNSAGFITSFEARRTSEGR